VPVLKRVFSRQRRIFISGELNLDASHFLREIPLDTNMWLLPR
jgi:hypothetical protein